MTASSPKIEVVTSNVLDYPCDVLLLKYAQSWLGADRIVAKKLNLKGFWNAPLPGDYRVERPVAGIQAGLVLFEGTVQLTQLSYASIRLLGKLSLLHLNAEAPNVKHIAMTMHGVNVGLDEREAFLAQVGGLLEALEDESILSELERITFVEFKRDRAERMEVYLHTNKLTVARNRSATVTDPIANAGVETDSRKHIFVAMPFTDDMEDVFIFGIQGPVQEVGMLCERVDMDIFTGDILDRIKSRIETASIVIADLTGSNANVYLEVGYAWGKNRKTLLLCKTPDELKFDVRGQRCIIYSSIRDLNKKLAEELKILAK